MSETRGDGGLPSRDEDGDLWDPEDLEALEPLDAEAADSELVVTDPNAVVGVEDLDVDGEEDDEDEDEDDEEDEEDDDGDLDFALLAWNDDGEWRVAVAEGDTVSTWSGFKAAVRTHAGADAALGFAGLDGSYLVVVRVSGTGERVLLSDVVAADELDFAADLLDDLRESDPALEELLDSGDLDDAEDPVVIGDTALLEDLGMTAEELRDVCADLDADPEDMVEEIADSLGIAAQMARALDALDG